MTIRPRIKDPAVNRWASFQSLPTVETDNWEDYIPLGEFDVLYGNGVGLIHAHGSERPIGQGAMIEIKGLCFSPFPGW